MSNDVVKDSNLKLELDNEYRIRWILWFLIKITFRLKRNNVWKILEML